MILVTVGMHSAPFDRLIHAADGYAASVEEEVVIQRGASRYTPRSARWFDYCDSAEMKGLMCDSRVVVCHAADTVLDVLQARRPVVAVPRRVEFREHLNDHQVDFAHALADRGWVQVLDDPDGLAGAILSASQMAIPAVPHPRLAGAMRRQLGEWFELR